MKRMRKTTSEMRLREWDYNKLHIIKGEWEQGGRKLGVRKWGYGNKLEIVEEKWGKGEREKEGEQTGLEQKDVEWGEGERRWVESMESE